MTIGSPKSKGIMHLSSNIKRLLKFIGTFAISSAVSFQNAAATPNLLTLGNFETGVGTWPQTVTGWTSRSGNTLLECSNSPGTYGIPAAPNGANFCEVEYNPLSPTSTPDWIQQTVTTTAAKTYIVSIQATNRANLNSQDKMIIYGDGNNLASVTTGNTWVKYSGSFIASTTSAVIRYISNGSATGSVQPGDAVGLMVDDAQVQQLLVSPIAQIINEDGNFSTTTFQIATNSTSSVSLALSVAKGKLTLANTTGLTFSAGANASGSFTITGTPAAINTALAAGLTYNPVADYNGSDTLTAIATSGTATQTDNIGITINPVADIVTDNLTTTENSALTYNAITGTNGASADNFENTPTIVTVSSPAHGTAVASTTTIGQIVYTPTAGYFGTDTYTYTVTSGGVTETATETITINPLQPSVTLTKVSNGNISTFNFTGTNGWVSQNITTTTAGMGAAGITQFLTAAGAATSISETNNAAYILNSASCTDNNSANTGKTGNFGTLSGNILTIPTTNIVMGAAITCTFTNIKIPTFKLQKTTNGGFGGPFTFTQTNLASSPANISTTVTATPTPTIPTAINVSTIGADITVTEGSTVGFFISSASCTDSNSAITSNTGSFGTLLGSTLTVPAAKVVAGADFVCVFSNTKGAPQFSIIKTPSTAGPISVGNNIIYTYTVKNIGNVTMTGVTVSDAHNGSGTFTGPGSEALVTDTAPLGDTTDAAINNNWDQLGVGDTIKFTATYVVTQNDIDTLQ